jgi:hypothetical protein
MIRDEINEENFYSLYAQAYALGCERLLEDLRELSITSLLNERTCLRLYQDAVEHKDKRIMDACSNVIIERFEEICSDENLEGLNHLVELGLTNLVQILRADNLYLINEETLIEVIRRYIAVRETQLKKAESAEQ